MFSPLFRICTVTLCFLAALPVRGEGGPTPVVWTFNDAARIGDLPIELWGSPKFIKEDGRSFVRFDGKDDGIVLPSVPIAGWKQFTIEILFRPAADGLAEQRFLHIQDGNSHRSLIELRLLPTGKWYLDTFLFSGPDRRLPLIDHTKTHPTGQWHWAALTYADGRMQHFVEGIKECEGEVAYEPMIPAGRTTVGVRQNKVYWFKGEIAEVRFTPEALPPEMLQRSTAK